MKCPSCQTESSGAYCPECGTPLKATCRACKATLPPNARFCIECGAAVRRGRSNAPWYIAGAALVALIVVVLLPGASSAPGAASPQSAPMLSGGAETGAPSADAGPPPLTGTPREQADRLFNLIMENKEKGDTAKAKFFVPMGVQAYGMAGDLDADGLYHLSLLQALGGNGRDAVATAEKILAKSPAHLLGLAAAAQGAAQAGDVKAAQGYYRRFLDAYATESTKQLPEYRDHAAALPVYRADAEKYLK